MKTLNSVLSKLEPDKKIKVGTKDGSNYMFCGTVDILTQNITSYSDVLRESSYIRVRNAEKNLAVAVKNPPTLTGYIEAELSRSNPRPSVDRWNDELRRWFKHCQALDQSKQAAIDYMKNFVWLGNRNVLETRDADPAIDEDTTIIIIKGNECGKFWDFDEVTDSPFGLRQYEEELL